MTDTGQIPGEGLPEGAGNGVPSGPVQGMGARQPGVPAPGAYTFVDPADPSENPADDDDLLLMPGAQGAWSEAQAQAYAAQAAQAQAAPQAQAAQAAHQPGPHETAGRDSGSVDLNGVRMPGAVSAASHAGSSRRPLHHGPSGPAVPDSSGSPVRTLADRGPAGATTAQQAVPARHAAPPAAGPEYLDAPRDDAATSGPRLGEIPSQGGAPQTAEQAPAPEPEQLPEAQHEPYAASAETVVPAVSGATEATEATEATDVTAAPQPVAAGVTEIAGAVEAVEAPQAHEALPAQEMAQAPQTPDAPQAPQASVTMDMPQPVVTAQAPEAPQGSEAPQAAQMPVAHDMPEAVAPLQAPEAPQAPQAPQVAEAAPPVQEVPEDAPAAPIAPPAAEAYADQTAHTAETAQAAETVQAPVQPVETTEAAQAAEIDQPVGTAETAQAFETTSATEAAQAVETAQATEVAQPVEAAQAAVEAAQAAVEAAQAAEAAEAAAATVDPAAAATVDPAITASADPTVPAPVAPPAPEAVPFPDAADAVAAQAGPDAQTGADFSADVTAGPDVVPGAFPEQAAGVDQGQPVFAEAVSTAVNQPGPDAQTGADFSADLAAGPDVVPGAFPEQAAGGDQGQPVFAEAVSTAANQPGPDAHTGADFSADLAAGPDAVPGAFPAQAPAVDQEQPVFAEAMPAAGNQPAFAVASAQPWGSAQAGQADFAPGTAQGAYAAAVAAQGHAPNGVLPAEARHAAPGQPHPEQQSPQGADAPEYAPLTDEQGEVPEPLPIGRFVPVEGSVPTTPHLAPTPPRPLVIPQDDLEAEQFAVQRPIGAPAEPTEPEGAVPAVPMPAPRDGAEPMAVDAGQAAEAAPSVDSPVPPVVAPAEFPAAPGTADPADELDEADEVISFEPIEANEVTEVAEAPEMAEVAEAPAMTEAPATEAPQAPQAPETAEGPELLAAGDAPEAAQAQAPAPAAAEAPGLLIIEEDPAEAAAPLTSPGTAAPGYADAEREAVLRVMRERRDIRNGFRRDPIPHEVLLRVLEAAHTAPSVGHSQPWDFVVIKSAETRRTMHELAQRQRDAYAKSLPKGRAKQFKELKIEAILDTPVNIVVTADPTRGGRHTLGRHTQPQMAPYSSALAVENLWLAARAEGLGVGWVSFFDEREMVRALGLPEHLEVVAYLCVGYVDEFPDEPELMQAGWSKRRPLSWVVHEETYGRRALPGEDPHDLLAETVTNIRPLDAKALGEAWERQKRMTKPPGALGMLEIISAQLSGLSRMCPPPIPEPAAVAIFAGDHGVHAQGVTAWPQEVTAQMVANFLGGGAVCNAFANQVGAEVCVIDVGVASELPATPGLLPRKVRAGTADMTTGPALTREEVKAAIEVGVETARDLVAAGNKALLTGEMGIANTTASAALISVYTEVDPAEVTGRGTGINDEMHARKVEVVRRALELHQPDPADPIGVLAAVGGLEHAAMVGLLLGGASLRTPVILDGVSAGAAALVARAIAPEVLAACIAGHRSAEPGHVAALNKLGLRPLVDLDLRLGEGTGALLALPIVQSAARAMHEVATFDSAGVTEK
ncbi:nicotinate-nucleotide--dimethylbenzimidazole phosphoribosyltransferase [Streptomyces sp. NPDC005900]|uniref:nicotinate-nucleotide--dimethylbenzimidazole phosphoribosyltransferase n=2 Tax=unclassified Streptomyces TaxID=2593676 RepID=UPI0033D6AAFA